MLLVSSDFLYRNSIRNSIRLLQDTSKLILAFLLLQLQFLYPSDPDILHHLAQYGEDAATAMFINCDNNGCELVEGVHETDGWYFDSKGAVQYSHSQMLMMSMEDTE